MARALFILLSLCLIETSVSAKAQSGEEILPPPISFPTSIDIEWGVAGTCVAIFDSHEFSLLHRCISPDSSIDEKFYSAELLKQLILDGKKIYDTTLAFYMKAGRYDQTPGPLGIDFLEEHETPTCSHIPNYTCAALHAFKQYLLTYGYRPTPPPTLTPEPTPQPTPTPTPTPIPGQVVYQTKCRSCHSQNSLKNFGATKIRNLFAGIQTHKGKDLSDQEVSDLLSFLGL